MHLRVQENNNLRAALSNSDVIEVSNFYHNRDLFTFDITSA